MNNFKKPYSNRTGNSRPGVRSKFGAGASPRSRAPSRQGNFRPENAELFDAICSNCGKKCQVPFRPNGTKPVYCKNCFGAPREALPALKRSSAVHHSEAPASAGGKSIADLTRQIAAMNAKIDAMLKILEGEGRSQE